MCEVKEAVILVIDDCEDHLFLMELLLGGEGYKVEKANCGQEGVAKANQIVPDLIVLDFMMPDMTGLDIIESIRMQEHLSQIPVLLCTANTLITKNDVNGVEDVCYKPIDIDNMLALVNSLIPCCKHSQNLTIVPNSD